MKMLGGEEILDKLMYFNPERWSKVYFSFGTKCDIVDNNMAECFNAWILGARHKTIITMLEEIRVKMMKGVGQMRDFCETWISDISPMAMKVLNDNTTRAWMFKGIPCPHAVAALHHKKFEPINYMSHWYNRETYMNTYSFFIQPVLNIKMWPQSQNISVMPPPVKKLSGRPGKNRKKEEGETKKKTENLSKRGIEISCGTCHSKGHNKRRCPTGAPAGTNTNPSPSPSAGADPSAGPSVVPNTAPTVGKGKGSTGKGRGRPPKNSTEKCADRPRMVGIGLLHTQSGGTILNIDVENKLGSRLKSLRDDCRLMDSGGGLKTKGCNKCLRTWREIAKNDMTKLEDDICRFSMLILLTSQRVSDESWVDKIFHYLGDNSLPLASSVDDSGNETRRRTKFKTDLWILIGGVVGMVLVIIVTLWILSKRKAEVKPSSGRYISDESYSDESTYRRLSLKEIYSATDNLSMSNFIGQALADKKIERWKVYKGILADRKHVAVKHIIKDKQMETFVREVTSLSHIKHPNLVSLLGHYDGPNECFLVYELCHNGNLSEWLFGKSKYLLWRRRLEIALDCARGFLFLHSYPEGSIPANILLSASFEAKFSDFGLSKLISIGHPYASSEVRGTFRYVDPEYQKNRHVNTYGDVYSFGIVLLQLLSGQRVINLDLKKPMPLK
ncbi:hypothetical protein CQW23_25314 [Capsicum baccatum]|uniref:Protein kinase domain-containing protein n=1 Tax=Capsicum baccatum TaxID=33114 RepID=A0A2G2VKK9_CAPBA|nr:hypothetical protein CQW23_25314 [Capsicum baccatum]